MTLFGSVLVENIRASRFFEKNKFQLFSTTFFKAMTSCSKGSHNPYNVR